MLFGVVKFILCAVKHKCGHGGKILAVVGDNYVGHLTITDVTVDGGNYGWDMYTLRGNVNNILTRGRDRGRGGGGCITIVYCWVVGLKWNQGWPCLSGGCLYIYHKHI